MEDKIIFKDLSYQIVGIAFKVFNQVGYGMSEKVYQKAFEQELLLNNLECQRELFIKKRYNGKVIGKYFLDFVIAGKIVVDLKVRPRIGYVHIQQVTEYLKTINYKLAIIIYFTKDGVKYRRVLNVLK